MTSRESIRTRIATLARVPLERVVDGAALVDVVPESFGLVEVLLDLQDELGTRLTHEDLRDLRTIGDLLDGLTGHAA